MQPEAQKVHRMKPTTTIRLLPNGDTLTLAVRSDAISVPLQGKKPKNKKP